MRSVYFRSWALFCRANRAEQCPVSGVKQSCRRNPETAEFDPQRSKAGSKSRTAAVSRSHFGSSVGVQHWRLDVSPSQFRTIQAGPIEPAALSVAS